MSILPARGQTEGRTTKTLLPAMALMCVSLSGCLGGQSGTEPYSVQSYDLSPDETQIVFSYTDGQHAYKLFVMPSVGGPARLIAERPGYDLGQPKFVDATHVSYIVREENGFTASVWQSTLSGGEAVQLTSWKANLGDYVVLNSNETLIASGPAFNELAFYRMQGLNPRAAPASDEMFGQVEDLEMRGEIAYFDQIGRDLGCSNATWGGSATRLDFGTGRAVCAVSPDSARRAGVQRTTSHPCFSQDSEWFAFADDRRRSLADSVPVEVFTFDTKTGEIHDVGPVAPHAGEICLDGAQSTAYYVVDRTDPTRPHPLMKKDMQTGTISQLYPQ